MAHVLFFSCWGCWFSLRSWWQLLCFDWTVGHHVGDALTKMALFWLRWQLAFFGMMIWPSTVEASVNGAGKQRCYLQERPLGGSQTFEIKGHCDELFQSSKKGKSQLVFSMWSVYVYEADILLLNQMELQYD